jgi:hypothetical protein
MRLIPTIAAILLPLLATSCVGYRLGGNKPAALANISSIHVALVQNDTQIPRAAAHATNAIADSLLQDGTYRLATSDQADARLTASLHEINYRQIRSTREDSQRSEELEMTVVYEWTLVDARNPLKILQQGSSKGTTSFFVDLNLQTARQAALPDALQRAANSMIARLADAF